LDWLKTRIEVVSLPNCQRADRILVLAKKLVASGEINHSSILFFLVNSPSKNFFVAAGDQFCPRFTANEHNYNKP